MILLRLIQEITKKNYIQILFNGVLNISYPMSKFSLAKTLVQNNKVYGEFVFTICLLQRSFQVMIPA